MSEKCSHEGTKMGEAMGHLKEMHRMHGHDAPAAKGNKPVGGAKQPMKAIKAMGKMGRKDG